MDLGIGIVLVVLWAVAMMGFAAEAFAGRPEFGNFSDAGAVAMRLEKYAGRLPAVLFALALIDACIIGASAVSLSTAYAIGDVLSLRHSLHRKSNQAKGFYGVYCGLMPMAAVLTPGTPLGLLTNAVQTLAGVLLPSATVFRLLLCNDKAVLGPWVHTCGINLFTGAVIADVVMPSLILTVSVLVPGITGMQIVGILIGGSVLAAAIAVSAASAVSSRTSITPPRDPNRDFWRMPPLEQLPPARLSTLERVWLIVLRTTSSLPAVLCRSGLSRWQLAAQNEPAGAFSNRRRSLIGISINVNTAKCETFAKRKESGADSSKSR